MLSVKGLSQETVVPFIVATAEGPGKLDPLDAYDSESIETIMQVAEGLYRYNYSSSEMESVPCLAAEMGTWEPGSGSKNLSITLKQGVTFHDGSKFNASAVKWNFDRLQYWTYGLDIDDDGELESHPLGTASQTLFAQAGVPILNRTEIVDEYEVKFVLNVASAVWEKLLAFIACAIVLPDPEYEMGDTFFNRIDINDELIGTGPFILTDYVFDNQVEFTFNPDYHEAWGENHIERMIYLIIPDPVTSSIAVLNHEVHWGGVLAQYQDQFDADPDLLSVRRKASVVYFIQMNLYNMPDTVRYASSFAWNHTYWLDETLGGAHYELHVPVPDGMEFHYEGFAGEPEYDIAKARELILAAPDTGIGDFEDNVTASGLSAGSTDAEWRAVAESSTPLAEFNFTRYQSNAVTLAATQLQDNLKDIGIKLTILEAIDWSDFVVDFLENPVGHRRLAFSFGGWGPDYNDPINMIEPLYGTNASSNCFGLTNATWNQMLLDTYVLTGDARRDKFYEIQEHFVKFQTPAFYILQLGGTISFNQAFVDPESIGDLLNVFSDLYWFNVKFIGERPIVPGYPIWIILGASGLTVMVIFVNKWKKIKKN